MGLHLAAKLGQRFAEKFLDFSAPKTDHVRGLLLRAGLVEVLAAAAVFALGGGGIYGRVLDPSGAIVPEARVSVAGKRLSSHDGVYRLDGLAGGAYTVTAEAPGFASVSREVAIVDGQLANVDL